MDATSLFVAHTVGSVAGVFCFAVGLEDECFELGFHFRFMILLVFSRRFQAGNFGWDSTWFGSRFCFVFLFLLLLFFALFGCFLGSYIGFLLSSNMFLYICVSVYYRFSVMSRAVFYSLGFDGLGGGYASGRLYVFFVINLSVCVSSLEGLFLFLLFKLFGFYGHILGRLFALSFLFFMTLLTFF